MVVTIFPSGGGAATCQVFGKRKRLAGLPSIEQTAGQIAAFNAGSRFAQQLGQFFQRAQDGLEFGSSKMPVCIPLFAHLQTEPGWACPLAGGRASTPTVFGRQAIHFDHRLVNPSLAVRNGGRQCVGRSTLLEGLEYAHTGLGFILCDGAGHPQTAIHVQHG